MIAKIPIGFEYERSFLFLGKYPAEVRVDGFLERDTGSPKDLLLCHTETELEKVALREQVYFLPSERARLLSAINAAIDTLAYIYDQILGAKHG